jgi:protein TonB
MNIPAWLLRTLTATGAAGWLVACGAPAPSPAPSAPVPQPSPGPAASPATPPAAPSSNPLRLASRDPSLEAYKRSAAERIHAANAKKLFDGRPHHLLKAVIIIDITVDRSGNVVASRISRSPKIAALDAMALASLKVASPLPAPPPALLARGVLVYSETWLVQNDDTFRVRTLTLPQE